MDHPEVCRVALLEMARRPHLTGGDDLISVLIRMIGNPVICWEVTLTYSVSAFRVEIGADGLNASVTEIFPSRPNLYVLG